MKKNEMEMMFKMFSMMMENENGNSKGKGKADKKPRGAMAIYKLQSEYDEKLYYEIAEEFGCLYITKDGKKFVGSTYENGKEVYTRAENGARIYREMDARAEAEGKLKPKAEVSKLEDMSKEELVAMLKKLMA